MPVISTKGLTRGTCCHVGTDMGTGRDGHMGTQDGGQEHCGHGKVLVGLIGGF